MRIARKTYRKKGGIRNEKMKRHFIKKLNITEEQLRYCSRTAFYKYREDFISDPGKEDQT